MSKEITNILIVFLVFIISGCASVSSPGGGPKDEQGPLLVMSNPEDQSTLFNSQVIEIEFNEKIQLGNYQEQIIITPRLSEEYEAKAKRQTLILNFQQELDSNTTYNINFREAVQDLTEKNPAKNLRLAFSTGDYIDSAYVEGKIISLLTRLPQEDIMVGIYNANDTLNLLNEAPSYLTITDEEGNYKITNLKPGDYKIYALKDANNNSILEFNTESYGFIRDTLSVDSSMTDLVIPIIKNDRSELELLSSRSSGKYFLMRYNKYISDYAIISEDSVITQFDSDHKGIKFYNSLGKDSTQLVVNTTDSLGTTKQDTVLLKFSESPRSPDPFDFSIELESLKGDNYIFKSKIVANKPSLLLNSDSLFIEIDSLNKIHFDSSNLKWDRFHSTLEIEKNIEEYLTDSTEIRLLNFYCGQNLLLSTENDSSQAKNSLLKHLKIEDTGVIEVEVDSEKSFWIELLDTKYNVVEKVENEKKFSFSYLTPGSYILRLLVDDNGDGIWSPGNILEMEPSETVIIYKKSDDTELLDLKANWILGPHVFSVN